MESEPSTPRDKETSHWMVLAHHPWSQRERCVGIPVGKDRRVSVCARCLGLYPTLFAVLTLQLAVELPPRGILDWAIVMMGVVPLMLDWGLSRLQIWKGTNTSRAVTGVIGGIAMARSFYLYFRDPRHEIFWTQVAMVAITVIAFEIVHRLGLKNLS